MEFADGEFGTTCQIRKRGCKCQVILKKYPNTSVDDAIEEMAGQDKCLASEQYYLQSYFTIKFAHFP